LKGTSSHSRKKFKTQTPAVEEPEVIVGGWALVADQGTNWGGAPSLLIRKKLRKRSNGHVIGRRAQKKSGKGVKTKRKWGVKGINPPTQHHPVVLRNSLEIKPGYPLGEGPGKIGTNYRGSRELKDGEKKSLARKGPSDNGHRRTRLKGWPEYTRRYCKQKATYWPNMETWKLEEKTEGKEIGGDGSKCKTYPACTKNIRKKGGVGKGGKKSEREWEEPQRAENDKSLVK